MSHPARTPVLLLTGVDPIAMETAALGLALDLPRAALVRHHIDVEAQVLTRTVSGPEGVLERERIALAHACVGCAVREDVVPTLLRLAESGRWDTLVAQLPVGAQARQVCGVLAFDAAASARLEVASVLCALDGPGVVEDLLGSDLLVERGRHTSAEDRRGVGETASAMVEYADGVVLVGDRPGDLGTALVSTLARPGDRVRAGVETLDVARLLAEGHDHGRTHAWADVAQVRDLAPVRHPGVWRLDLTSPHPFHPGRMRAGLGRLGAGRHRSRGCFHLTTRPGRALEWDGAGGQLSIGRGERWGGRAAHTRLMLVGVGPLPADLPDAFAEMLLRPHETTEPVDGLDPWLGPLD